MQHTLLIVAPFPDEKFVSEGWMSRIRAVDKIFSNVSRAYINFGDHHTENHDGHAVQCDNNVFQYNLNAKLPSHQQIFEQLLQSARLAYVHTVHLAINVRKWLHTGKIVVDIHGIVPEEELMLGRPEEAKRFSPVEEEVLTNCRVLVTVTRAMQHHLINKYPSSKANFITLPIFESYSRDRKSAESISDTDKRLKILYAGGSQVWQNVDLMLEVAKDMHSYADFTFLSHDKNIFMQKAKSIDIADNVTIRSATKSELPAIYKEHDFGFVLRDKSPVNTVSCPTKLSEYMDFGLIPIVKYTSLGDFEKYGYNYITDEDVRSLMLPDATCRTYMIQENYKAIDHLINEYEVGSSVLLNLLKN
jgi:hypothetical protein